MAQSPQWWRNPRHVGPFKARGGFLAEYNRCPSWRLPSPCRAWQAIQRPHQAGGDRLANNFARPNSWLGIACRRIIQWEVDYLFVVSWTRAPPISVIAGAMTCAGKVEVANRQYKNFPDFCNNLKHVFGACFDWPGASESRIRSLWLILWLLLSTEGPAFALLS